jgi:glutamyl-tRNA reductase
VELARHVFGDLAGKRVLVIGAGKMSILAARHLRASGAIEIGVTNRSAERAAELAEEIDGVAKPWHDLKTLLSEADVVISSTASAEPVLTKKLVKSAIKARRFRRQVIVDIAVPRDADPAVGKLDGVYLFDIDDLQSLVAENLKARQEEADSAEEIIAAEVIAFEAWQRSQKVVPTIRDLRKHFSDVASSEVEKILATVRDEADPEKREQAVRRLGSLIVNKLLHTPMAALKSDGDVATRVEVTRQLFDLPDAAEEAAAEAAPAKEAAVARAPSGTDRESSGDNPDGRKKRGSA